MAPTSYGWTHSRHAVLPCLCQFAFPRFPANLFCQRSAFLSQLPCMVQLFIPGRPDLPFPALQFIDWRDIP